MINVEEIRITATRMAELLRLGGIEDWAQSLDALGRKVEKEPERVVVAIRSMYGGMGSLNDLVLYRDGKVMAKENVELDSLRAKLYQLCR